MNLEWHEDVPKHKISADKTREFMQALVFRFNGGTGMGADYILRHLVNDRPGKPNRENSFMWHKSDPEPGVIRFECGTNTKAVWDEVIIPSSFRPARLVTGRNQ